MREYTDKTKQFAYEHGYVETLLGRRRYLPELQASNYNVRQAAERMAINMPVQGTSADIIKVAMLHVADQLAATGLPVRMLLQVHDELVFECDAAVLDACADLVVPLMENAVTLDVPVKVDAKVGASWDDMEPIWREYPDYGRRIRAGARPGGDALPGAQRMPHGRGRRANEATGRLCAAISAMTKRPTGWWQEWTCSFTWRLPILSTLREHLTIWKSPRTG